MVRDRIDVVLELVGGPRLDDEQRALGLEQRAYFFERRLRRGEIVDAVAGGDEVETFAAIEIAGGRSDKGNAAGEPGFGGAALAA